MAIALIFTSVWIPKQIQNKTVESAEQNALRTVKQFVTLRSYYTENIIKKVKQTGAVEVTTDHEGKKGAVPSSATMIHDLSAILAKEGTQVKLYSAFPFPNRATRELDAFQQEAWDTLVKTPEKTFKKMELTAEGEVLRVALADSMTVQACVNCHNSRPDTPKNDWKLGDVRGVLEVAIPIASEIANGESLAGNR